MQIFAHLARVQAELVCKPLDWIEESRLDSAEIKGMIGIIGGYEAEVRTAISRGKGPIARKLLDGMDYFAAHQGARTKARAYDSEMVDRYVREMKTIARRARRELEPAVTSLLAGA